MDIRPDIIGYFAAGFTTMSLLPQILRIRRLKEAKDISLLMPFMMAAGSLLWTVYGLMIWSPPIIAANAVALVIALTTALFAVRYR